MNKRGSHVGMILSFVMFVTALIFIYGILQPSITPGEDKSQLVKQIEDKLPTYSDSALFSLKISYPGCCEAKTCFSLDKSTQLDKRVQKMNFLSKDKEGNLIDSSSDSENVSFQKNPGNYTNVLFSLENFSHEDTPLTGCYPLSLTDYNSSFSSKDYTFESKIKTFIGNLSQQDFYNQRKVDFNLPPGTEFSLVFIYQNGSRFGKVTENITTNVFVDEFSVYYVNSTADTNPGFIEVSVW